MQFQEGQSDEASLKRWLDEKGVYKVLSEMKRVGTSLAVQWFRLHASKATGEGLVHVGELRPFPMPRGTARRLKKGKVRTSLWMQPYIFISSQ